MLPPGYASVSATLHFWSIVPFAGTPPPCCPKVLLQAAFRVACVVEEVQLVPVFP
jgi:hypothetical protein